jgi:DNA-binding XRE family transcriptional regulator
MPDLEYQPVAHEQQAFLEKALKRKGFQEAYEELDDEYRLVRELLCARSRAGLTQEAVAERMGTSKSAVSRLEGPRKHSPSVITLQKVRARGRLPRGDSACPGRVRRHGDQNGKGRMSVTGRPSRAPLPCGRQQAMVPLYD